MGRVWLRGRDIMNVPRIMKAIASLKLMKFFPGDEDACLALADDLAAMATTEEQIEWTVRRVRNLYSEWPGIHEVRAVFCSRFKPRDGINAYSAQFIDGVPPERAVPEPAPRALPPGHVTADVELNAAVQEVFTARPVRRLWWASGDVPLSPNFQPITQADIDRAVSESREKRAQEALKDDAPKDAA